MSCTPTYVIKNGQRSVLPYFQSCTTNIKSRWEGRTVIDVFCTELGEDPEVIQHDIESNKIYVIEHYPHSQGPKRIEGWPALQKRLIQKHDVIYNLRHMHEPPVTIDNSVKPNVNHTSINIVYRDDNYLVVNKPSGIPVHPAGKYNFNSVTEVLKHDLKLDDVWLAHRLDKGTSGILILGLNKTSGTKLSEVMREKSHTTKTYLARVQGRFPGSLSHTEPVFSVSSTGGYLRPSTGDKVPVNSTTNFKCIRYNSNLDESIVECVPVSGKMHQIRIHLRNLGFPITNDSSYNVAMSSPINVLKNEIELELYALLHKKYEDLHHFEFVDVKSLIPQMAAKLQLLKKNSLERLQNHKTGFCDECGRKLFEMEVDSTGVYLHAYKYEIGTDINQKNQSFLDSTDDDNVPFTNGPDTFVSSTASFQTPVPDWCDI